MTSWANIPASAIENVPLRLRSSAPWTMAAARDNFARMSGEIVLAWEAMVPPIAAVKNEARGSDLWEDAADWAKTRDVIRVWRVVTCSEPCANTRIGPSKTPQAHPGEACSELLVSRCVLEYNVLRFCERQCYNGAGSGVSSSIPKGLQSPQQSNLHDLVCFAQNINTLYLDCGRCRCEAEPGVQCNEDGCIEDCHCGGAVTLAAQSADRSDPSRSTGTDMSLATKRPAVARDDEGELVYEVEQILGVKETPVNDCCGDRLCFSRIFFRGRMERCFWSSGVDGRWRVIAGSRWETWTVPSSSINSSAACRSKFCLKMDIWCIKTRL